MKSLVGLDSDVIIIDTIGIHSGMHYYNESLILLFNRNGIRAKVYSNYRSKNTKKLFFNIYTGNIIIKVIKIFQMLCSIAYLSMKVRDLPIIYHSFGMRWIDVILLSMLNRGRLILDIHDVLPLKNTKYNSARLFMYKKLRFDALVHSQKSKDAIKKINIKGKIIFIPLLKYSFSKKYNLKNIGSDITEAISKYPIYYLFFGNLRESKGIDILMKAITILNYDGIYLPVVIAGKGRDQKQVEKFFDQLNGYPIVFVNRYINDDEMKYLFTHARYLLLPYKEIYQSAIYDMGVHFRTPMLLSPAFQEVLGENNSFYSSYSPNDAESLAKKLKLIHTNYNTQDYFDISDLNEYYNDSKYKPLIEEFL